MNKLSYEFRQIPFLRLVITLSAGILIQFYLALPLYIGTIAASAGLISLFMLKLISRKEKLFHFQWLWGIMFSLTLAGFGMILTSLNTATSEIKDDPTARITFTAKITNAPKETTKSVKAVLELLVAQNDSGQIVKPERVLVFFEKDSLAKRLKYGDIITAQASIKPIQNAGNPNEFDYKSYLFRQKITGQAYLNAKKWKKSGSQQQFNIYTFAHSLRNQMLRVYRNCGIAGEEFAVISALTLGYTDDLEPEIKQAFSATGTMHILSVSGLHVGIIYVLLNFMLGFLKKYKRGQIFHALICISFLWFFALLSGLSPSVERSALMFSTVILASLFNKKSNIYNSLASSAFILLLVNPFNLFDVGFQLSYLALLSIIILQPYILALFNPKNKVIKSAWELTAVSLAAQIGTLPISFYYFHQFPSTFILANLVAIPLSTAIMYGAFFLLVISSIPFVSTYIGIALYYCTFAFNQSLKFLEGLPHSTISGIYVSFAGIILLYLIIISIFIFWTSRRFTHFRLILISTSAYLIYSLIYFISIQQTNSLWIYNIKNTFAYSYIENQAHCFLTDSSLVSNPTKRDYYLKNHWIKLQSTNPQIINVQNLDSVRFKSACFIKNFWVIRGKTFCIIRNKMPQIKAKSRLKIDYLILSQNAKTDIKDLLELFDPKLIVIDSSNYWSRCQYWLRENEKIKAPLYCVSNQGALEIKF
jgi:competence protein ComEC